MHRNLSQEEFLEHVKETIADAVYEALILDKSLIENLYANVIANNNKEIKKNKSLKPSKNVGEILYNDSNLGDS